MKASLIAVIILLATPILLGWFHVLSKESYFAANPHVQPGEVRANPEQFRGTVLLLAGQIVEQGTDAGGSRLEVLCFTRDEADRPVAPDPFCGRLLLVSSVILNGDRFRMGTPVTFAARVTGETEGKIPVLDLLEIYSWAEPREILAPPYYYYGPWPGWCDPWFDPTPLCDPFYPYPNSHGYLRFRWGW